MDIWENSVVGTLQNKPMKKIETTIQPRRNKMLVKNGNLVRIGIFHWFSQAYVFTFYWVWNQATAFYKGILQSPLSDCSLDGVVSNCTGMNLVIIPGVLIQQQQATDISVHKPFNDHMRRDYESWFVRNLLWRPADKIKKAPAQPVKWGQ